MCGQQQGRGGGQQGRGHGAGQPGRGISCRVTRGGGGGGGHQREPERHGGERQRGGQQPEHRHVEPDTDVAAAGGEQIKEEALVEALQQVVEAAEGSLYDPAQGVEVSRRPLLVPDGDSLQGDSLDTEPVEQTVVAGGHARGLGGHHGGQGLQTAEVAFVRVWAGVILPLVEHAAHPLPAHQPRHQVHQVQVGQLPVQSLQLEVDVGRELGGELQVDGGLDAAGAGGEVAGVQDALRAAADPVVALQPGLGAEELVLGHQEDDVLGPVDLGAEVLGGGEQQRDAGVRGLVRGVGRAVRRREDQRLGAGGLGGPQHRVQVGPREGCVGQGVGQPELLLVHLQPHLPELRLQPGQRRRARVLLVLLGQRAQELHGGALLVEAPGHEPRQQRVLGEICPLVIDRMRKH